jgi:hypothetical protein
MRFWLTALRWRSLRARIFAAALAITLLPAMLCQSQAADPEPKRVLMVQSFGLRFKPWTDFAEYLRSEMIRQSEVPIDFQDHSLLTARLDDDEALAPFVDYLLALYAKKPRTSSSPSARRPPSSCSDIALTFFPIHQCCLPP